MVTSYWDKLDTQICTYLDEQLGADSDYEELQLVSLTKPVVLNEASDWEEWADSNATPAITVQGRLAEYAVNQHGFSDGLVLASAYPYTITAIVKGTQEECRTNCKALIERMITALLATRGFSILIDGFSKDYFVNIVSGGVHVWGSHDGEVGKFYGVAVIGVRLHDGSGNA